MRQAEEPRRQHDDGWSCVFSALTARSEGRLGEVPQLLERVPACLARRCYDAMTATSRGDSHNATSGSTAWARLAARGEAR